jgi:multiple sugar transport system permease protein
VALPLVMGKREKRDFLKGMAFISPWVVGFCVFTAAPIALSLYFSFCDYSLVQKPVFRGTENYRLLAGDPLFWKSLGNTFYYASLALPLSLIVALTIAMLLNTKIRGQSVYRTLVFLPSLVPIVASAMIWLWLFNAKLGLLNWILRSIGIDNPPGWLSDTRWAMPSIVVTSLWGVGQTVVIYLAGLQDVPVELYEAAEIDGAGPVRKIFHVTLPMLSPVIFFNLIIGMIGAIRIFEQPYIITQGGPARSTYTFTMYLVDNAFTYLRMGYASAMAWVQLLLILVLTALAFWSGKHWVHVQGRAS